MQKGRIRTILVLMLLTAFVPSCSSVTPTEVTAPPLTVIVEPTSPSQNNILQSEEEVPRISVQQALAAIQSGAAVIVDVRSAEAYEASHVAGALSIPLAEIETTPNGLPLEKDQWIITYCT